KRISKIILLAFAISAYSCTTDTQGPLTYNGDKPQQVRIVNVENLAGGAKVFYSLPDDPNVLYILCEYVLPNGEKKVVKSSDLKRISKIILLAFAISAYSCTTDTQGPLTYNGDKPQQVRIVNVENLAGGAKVFYSLPDDPNVLYILCEYVLPNGEKKVVKASNYTNYVQLEGFSKSISQEVNIYTVSRSEVSSEPVKVTIQPLDGRIHQVYETLQVKETFGGVNAVFLNPSQEELILYTLVKDNDGNWVTFDRLYTNSADRNYSVRGLDSEPTEFGFYFADKWNNRTDTLVKTLTPLYERMLDKKLWKNAKLLNDSYQPQLDVWMLENLWDSPGNGQLGGLYHGDPAEPGIEMPSWFTIDLGARYVFSRI